MRSTKCQEAFNEILPQEALMSHAIKGERGRKAEGNIGEDSPGKCLTFIKDRGKTIIVTREGDRIRIFFLQDIKD